MGAIANQAPEAFGGIATSVPFVDPLTSMLDASLPLTVTEYDEWGDPASDPEVYDCIAAYAPYDNVAARDYPPILAETSLHDTRVLYVEPAKWVARLRADGAGRRRTAAHRDVGRPRRGVRAVQVVARPRLQPRLDPRPDGPRRARLSRCSAVCASPRCSRPRSWRAATGTTTGPRRMPGRRTTRSWRSSPTGWTRPTPPADQELNDALPTTKPGQVGNLFSEATLESADRLEATLDEMAGLEPPEGAEAAHEELLAATRAELELSREFAATLAGLDQDAVENLRPPPEQVDIELRTDVACLTLQRLAEAR